MKRANRLLGLGVGILLLSPNAGAGDLDGAKALACDLAEVAECDGVAQCTDVTAEQIDLPRVVHVDFAGRRLASPDGQRTSPITAFEALETTLVLQGHQNGRGWTMVIERATGRLSATLADVEGAFVLAGSCSILDQAASLSVD
jgi:hypothetical protein